MRFQLASKTRGVVTAWVVAGVAALAGCAGDDAAEVNLPPACLDHSHVIERPVLPDDPDRGELAYRVQVLPGTDPQAPTVVYLPGGPGDTSIGTAADTGRKGVPAELGLVLTDPRGLGCNQADLPEAAYRTDLLAEDVLAAVEALELRDFILYGHSYGTVLATTVGALAEARGLAVRAVVLEGTVGRRFVDDEMEQGFVSQWHQVRDALSDPVRTVLAEAAPLGQPAEAWGTYLGFHLSVGQADGFDLAGQLALAAPDQPASARESLATSVAEIHADASGDSASRHPIVRGILCAELADEAAATFALVGGELGSIVDYCEGAAVVRPYDAAAHRLDAPIYYVQGTNDPNTPLAHAEYHFSTQTGATRTMLRIEGAGHQPTVLNLGDCLGALWGGIVDGTSFATAASGCAWPTSVQTAPRN